MNTYSRILVYIQKITNNICKNNLKQLVMDCNYFKFFIKNQYLHVFLFGLFAGASFLCKTFCSCVNIGPILLFVGLNRLWMVISNVKKSEALRCGFLFGIGYFLFSVATWTIQPFQFINIPNTFVCVLCAIFSSTILALYLSIFPAISTLCSKNPFVFSLAWTVCEILRGTLFTGFPWALVGYVLTDYTYMIQIANLITVYGVSFLFVLASTVQNLFTKCIIAAFVLIYGVYRVEHVQQQVFDKEFYVVLVQPSIKQNDKLNKTLYYHNIKRHIDLSKLYQVSDIPTIIVWPEAVFVLSDQLIDYIKTSIKSDMVSLVSGVEIVEDGKYFNSLIVIDKTGITARYDKKHLVPFGEFIPSFFRKIGFANFLPATIDYTRGTRERILQIKSLPKITPLICYESVFPKQITEKQSSIMLNITNDAWFEYIKSKRKHHNKRNFYRIIFSLLFDCPNENRQHLTAAKFRAIEENKPMIVCANNGFSCIINEKGQIKEILNINETGVIKYKFGSN